MQATQSDQHERHELKHAVTCGGRHRGVQAVHDVSKVSVRARPLALHSVADAHGTGTVDLPGRQCGKHDLDPGTQLSEMGPANAPPGQVDRHDLGDRAGARLENE